MRVCSALLAVARADTDTDTEGHSTALSRFMVRSESAASSKIERINATARDYAKAIAGNKGNPSATTMVAASRALHELITTGGWPTDRGSITHRKYLRTSTTTRPRLGKEKPPISRGFSWR